MLTGDRKRSSSHANCLIIGNMGILIYGESGSGKTSLMLRLLDQASVSGNFAAMVADDQVLLFNSDNRLLAQCPLSTAGRYEIHGLGIKKRFYIPSAIIGLVVEIIPAEKLDRMPQKHTKTINDLILPSLFVPQHFFESSTQIIFATLNSQN